MMGIEGEEKLDMAQEVSLASISSDKQEAKVCSDAIDSVFNSAKMVATYLVQRSGTSKANKTSIDSDYKAVFDTLVGDLLTVLYRPEWPAASLFLNVISRLMV
jgi:cohesin loading factor subunit SCC2